MKSQVTGAGDEILRGWENAKLCLQLNLMSIFLCLTSFITAFSSLKKIQKNRPTRMQLDENF